MTTTTAARRPGGRRARRCRGPAPSRTSAASRPTRRCVAWHTVATISAACYAGKEMWDSSWHVIRSIRRTMRVCVATSR